MLNGSLTLTHVINIYVDDSTLLKPFNDLSGMILTFGSQLEGIYGLIQGISYVLGIVLVAAALYKLRKTGITDPIWSIQPAWVAPLPTYCWRQG